MINLCKLEECSSPCYGNGYCNRHNYGFKKYGNPLAVREYLKGGGTGFCSIDQCAVEVRAKNYCVKHLERFTKYGSPYITKHASPGSGCTTEQGYRIIRINGSSAYEHRHVMEDYLGRKLAAAEEVHHLDGNKLNNTPNNLIILSKKDHAKLHAYYKLYS